MTLNSILAITIVILSCFLIVLIIKIRTMKQKITELELQNQELTIKSGRGKVLRISALPVGKRFSILHAIHVFKGTHVYLVLESMDKELWTTSRIVLCNIKREIVSNHILRHGDIVEIKMKTDDAKGVQYPVVELASLATAKAKAVPEF